MQVEELLAALRTALTTNVPEDSAQTNTLRRTRIDLHITGDVEVANTANSAVAALDGASDTKVSVEGVSR